MNRFIKRLCIWAIVFLIGAHMVNLKIYAAIDTLARLASTITIPEDTVLILGDEGKYIFRDSGELQASIPAGAWDAPAGYYDEQTRVVIGNHAFVRSVVPATIQQVIGDESSTLTIAEGSHLTVSTQNDYGIYAGLLVVGSPDPATSTDLNVSAGNIAIDCANGMEVHAASYVNASGFDYGIRYGVSPFSWSATLVAHPTSKITATATGESGIGIKGDGLDAHACEIAATAPRGIGGIQLDSFLNILAQDVGGVAVRGVVDASSHTGRAIAVGYGEMSGSIQVEGSVLRGVTQRGQAGVYASHISAINSADPFFPAEVFGSADVGFGVVGQMLDYDSEFPSGGLSVQQSKVIGHVNEGMGISSFILSSYASGEESDKRTMIEGIAQKGIGISVCSGYADHADIIGKSYGSSDKHFQVYNSIADSAGINFLSYFHTYDDVTILVEAPLEDPDSFGLHGLLNSADGSYRGGEIHAYPIEHGFSITAKGGTGISLGGGINLYSDGQAIDIAAHGSVNGIETTRLESRCSSTTETPIIIDAVGENGTGLISTPILEDNYYYFNLSGTSLRTVGGQYGTRFQLHGDSSIISSRINAAATGDGPDATGFYIEQLTNDEYPSSLYLSDSIVKASGKQYGWHSKNINTSITKDLPLFHTDGMFTARGGETGLLVEFDSNITPDGIQGLLLANNSGIGNALVTVVSDSVPPDQIGRNPAVKAPLIQLTDTVTLLEEYLAPISQAITEIPYMAYAEGQNIANLENYGWNDSSIPIEASIDGLWTNQPDHGSQILIGKRGVPLPGEIVTIESGGEHRIQLTTKPEEYTVVFETNGGKPVPSPQLIPYGGLITVPTPPVRSGYIFTGWHQLNGSWDFATDVVLSDMTLYAGWIETIREPSIVEDRNNTIREEVELPEGQIPLGRNPSTGAAKHSSVAGMLLLSAASAMSLFKSRK